MDGSEIIGLEEPRLTETSRQFLKEFLTWKPEWKKFCSMDINPYGCDLRIDIPSPTGDPLRSIGIWYATSELDISLEWHWWHIHGHSYFESAQVGEWDCYDILETLKMIVSGKIVYYQDSFNAHLQDPMIYADKYQLTDVLTDPRGSGKIAITSWSGERDGSVSLNDQST